MNWRQALALLLLGLALPALAWAWATELAYLNAYLNPGVWLRISAVAVALGWLLLALALRRHWGPTPIDRFRSLAALLLAVGLTLPLLISASNRWRAPIETIEVEFDAEEGRYNSRFGLPATGPPAPNQYLVFFYWQDQLYRIVTKRPYFSQRAAGEPIQLPLRRGRWGIYWIDTQRIHLQLN